MTDPRAEIVEIMVAEEISVAEIARRVDGAVPRSTVYNYLTGSSRISDDRLGPILDAVDLEIVRKPKTRRSHR